MKKSNTIQSTDNLQQMLSVEELPPPPPTAQRWRDGGIVQKKVDEIERRISVTSLQQEHEMLEQSVLQQEVEKFQRQQQQHLIREERSPGTANMNNIVRTSLNNNNNNTSILRNDDSTNDLFEDPNTKTVKVRVALRIRPLIKREMLENTVSCVLDDEEHNEVIIGREPKQRRFTYDYVLGPQSSQQDVYDRCHVASLVDGCFHGYNATIFAYGQTGSGKTYTMGSSSLPETRSSRNNHRLNHNHHHVYEDDSISNSFVEESNNDPNINYSDNVLNINDPTAGILPRVAKRLFDKITNNHQHVNHNGRKLKFTVRMTFIEIHKEKVRDLLRPDVGPKRVAVRDDGKGGIRISGLKPIVLKSETDLLKHVNRGCILRTTGKTLMNDRSSRSHALITLMLEQEYDLTEEEIQRNKLKRKNRKKKRRGRFNNHGGNNNSNNNRIDDEMSSKRPGYRCAKLHIVDLAGSERQKRTGAVGNRFQESVRINQGLLALGNVISALGDPRKNRRRHHVPYRESKLTRLLQDSLGGNSQTLMIACVTPALNSLEETLNVLKYANRARNIKNKAKVNVEPELPEVSDEDSLTEEGDLNEENDEEEIMVQDLDLGNQPEMGEQSNLNGLKEENNKMSEMIVLNEQEKIQIQLELQKCQDEMMNVKNDLVSSEARVSFLQDKVQSLETELHGARRERNQVEQALIDARKDLERDEVIFAEKIRQMAELQKKATKFYKDKKNLKEEIISLKAKLKRMEKAIAAKESSKNIDPIMMNNNVPNKLMAISEEMDDIGVQTSFTISKNDNNNDDATESQDIGVQTTHDEFVVKSQNDIIVQDIEVEEKEDEDSKKISSEEKLKSDGNNVKKSIKFVSTGLMKKSTSDEDDDDEVTIMIGEESFAAVNNSMMNISRMESGKENVAPTNNENDDENSNIASQRSRIEVSSSSAQLTAAWLEDVTDKFVQRNEDKEFLMNKTARLRVLNNEKEQAELALRNSVSNYNNNDSSKDGNQQNTSNLDSELLENHLEALEVEVEVETAAVNDLQNTMTNDPKVGLADIYEALDDLEEGEARALLRRCCSRMAKLKRDRGKFEVEMNQKNMKIQAQSEQLANLEMTLHQSSIEYDRRLREQRQKYEAKMGALLRRSLTINSTNKPVTVRMSRKQLKEINPFENKRRSEFI